MPGIAEVLAGQWERHSRFFYENRVEKMKALLITKPDDQDAMDNLAVAYHKLGQSDAAIAVMLDKEKRFPGQYTTYSNLGTFYMLRGNLDDAIICLKNALAINPNAHFGREEYQLDLAEYLRKARTQPNLLNESFIFGILNPPGTTTSPTPQSDDAALEMALMTERYDFGRSAGNPARFASLGLKANIFDGVVGMLRFGTDQSPDLYFALGDLLALHGDKNLAVRAYKRALDLNYSHPEAVKKAMDSVKELEVPRGGLDPAVIAAERVDAANWVADYQKFEDNLIRSGKDTDDESNYAAFYAKHGRALITNDVFIGDYTYDQLAKKYLGTLILIMVGISIGCVLIIRWVTRQINAYRSK